MQDKDKFHFIILLNLSSMYQLLVHVLNAKANISTMWAPPTKIYTILLIMLLI